MKDTSVTVLHRHDGTCVLQWKNGKWTACDHNQGRGYSSKEAVAKAAEIKARLQAGEKVESSVVKSMSRARQILDRMTESEHGTADVPPVEGARRLPKPVLRRRRPRQEGLPEQDTQEFHRGIRHELKTYNDLEIAKERAFQNLQQNPQHYAEIEQRLGQEQRLRDMARRKSNPPRLRTTQRLRLAGESLSERREPCPLKPAPKGPFRDKELEMGREEEREHTTSAEVADTIAKQHLGGKKGVPDYYSKLRKHVEPRAKAFLLALPPSSSAPSGA